MGLPLVAAVKNLAARQELQETGFDPFVGKIPWRRERQFTGESHGQRTLMGCGHKESERLK